MDPENITLKPLPPKIEPCSVCKKTFLSRLRLNGEFYRSCDECRQKSKIQGAKTRSNYKKFIMSLK